MTMKEPEMIEITERRIDPLDQCQYNTPMSFCRECGAWMNCKRDGIDLDWRRRPDRDEQ